MSDQFSMPYSSTLIATHPQKMENSEGVALTVAQAIEDRKGEDILVLRVAEVSYLADYFAIATGFSKVQVRAIAQSVEDKLQQEWQRLPIHVEGKAEGSWILLDYGDVIVHIMLPQEREFYNLEAFWGHAEQIDFQSKNPELDEN
ncbi:MAG: ribosome silencing factor [Kastovskya adunca ATA6-11-RM4]|jgi:ribosome-associated protein|nr:ribosome silencing factor [Kastovskya adunca ATA6-11-RM4]